MYQYPASNFHDLNLDWLLEQMKKCLAEWEETKEDWQELSADNAEFKEYVTNYFNNLDLTEEISAKIDALVQDGTILELLTEDTGEGSPLSDSVGAWLSAHITQETGYVIDDTLTVEGAAADAKAAGDAIRELNATVTPIESAYTGREKQTVTVLGTGFITANGVYQASANWKITVLPVTPGEIYDITAYFNAISATQTAKAVCSVLNTLATSENYQSLTDSNVIKVAGIHGNTYGAVTDDYLSENHVIIPTGAVCMMVSCTNIDQTMLPTVLKYTYENIPNMKNILDAHTVTIQHIANGFDIVWNNNAALVENGTTVAVNGYSTSNYILLDEVILHASFDNLRMKKSSTIVPVCFYDVNKTFIGYYDVTVSEPNKPNNTIVYVNISDIVGNYNGAKYIRVGKQTSDIVTVHTQTINNDYPSHKMAMFRKAIFVGDSVTAGFVVEGTEEYPAKVDTRPEPEGQGDQNPGAIYSTMSDYSPPSQIERIFPGIEITNSSQTGISVNEYYSNVYPNVDFSEYDLIVIELGYNGGGDGGYLNMSNLTTSGKNAYNYDAMAQAIRAQNEDATIVLVRSSDKSNTLNWPPVLYAIANNCNGIVVDLTDNTYLNLQDNKYHGYYLPKNGSATIDKAHFTRLGYNAKAYVLSRLIANKVFAN